VAGTLEWLCDIRRNGTLNAKVATSRAVVLFNAPAAGSEPGHTILQTVDSSQKANFTDLVKYAAAQAPIR
jgi:hypothetical protein